MALCVLIIVILILLLGRWIAKALWKLHLEWIDKIFLIFSCLCKWRIILFIFWINSFWEINISFFQTLLKVFSFGLSNVEWIWIHRTICSCYKCLPYEILQCIASCWRTPKWIIIILLNLFFHSAGIVTIIMIYLTTFFPHLRIRTQSRRRSRTRRRARSPRTQ